MERYYAICYVPLMLALVGSTVVGTQTQLVHATNESSYHLGYSQGILGEDVGYSCVNPPLSLAKSYTNSTSCRDGWFNGYKDRCYNSTNTKSCLDNIFTGDFPDTLLKIHKQYLAGNRTANDSGTSMCPIGYNAAFCAGWDNNNDDYGEQDCSDSPVANISQDLTGCPADIMTNSQIAGIPELVGKWNFINQTETQVREDIPGISGTMLFNNNGYYLLTVPNHNPYGDYRLEASWGTLGHNILTICYAGNCENNTLITITPNFVKIQDNNGNILHLTKIQPTITSIVAQARAQVPRIATSTTHSTLNGTWNMTSNGAVNKTLGQITFGSPQDNRFTGTFNGNKEAVSGTYSTLAPANKPYAGLYLDYAYQGHKVSVAAGNLNVTDHDNMKVWNISVLSLYKKTGLYIHPGYIISFTRAQPIALANNFIGHWTFYNETTPAVTTILAHGPTTEQMNMTDIFDDSYLQPTIQTNSDRENWTDYVMSLENLKTGNILFDSSDFVVSPPGNNGSASICNILPTIICGAGGWSITPDNNGLKLGYYTGISSFSFDNNFKNHSKYLEQGKYQPGGSPLQLPPISEAPRIKDIILTLRSVTPEQMVATDSHGDTILFIRNHSPQTTTINPNLVGTWKFSSAIVNRFQPAVSGEFVFKPGTKTFPVSNANFTIRLFNGKFANGTISTYTFPYSIGWGIWEIGNDVLSLTYHNGVTELWLIKVIDSNTVEIYGNNNAISYLSRVNLRTN